MSDLDFMMCHNCRILQPCDCDNSWANRPLPCDMSDFELCEEALEAVEYSDADLLGEIRREYKSRINKRLEKIHAV